MYEMARRVESLKTGVRHSQNRCTTPGHWFFRSTTYTCRILVFPKYIFTKYSRSRPLHNTTDHMYKYSEIEQLTKKGNTKV